MPELALAMWAVYGIAALGIRVAIHKRRTGSTGVAAVNAPPGTIKRAAEITHVFSLLLGLSAPILALLDVVEPIDALDKHPVHAVGVALFIAGLAFVVWAQATMGDSWRIGTDPDERTELVVSGPFKVVRNPIFAGLIPTTLGLALVVPSVVALASVVAFTVSIELEARLIEEPHLLKVHGESYAAYARRVGRFFPGVGRLALG